MLEHLRSIREFYKQETGGWCVSEKYVFEMLKLIAIASENRKSYRVLDMGCGFSTIALKHYEKNNPNITVYATDTSQLWLDKTKEVIDIYFQSSIENIYLIDDFVELPAYKFDFISFDIGQTKQRPKYLPIVYQLIKSTTILMIDDMHKHYIRRMYQGIEKEYFFNKLPDIEQVTLDNYGRYAVAITDMKRKE